MHFLRKTEADFRFWCKQLVPKSLVDCKAFADERLDVHKERQRYDDAIKIRRQLHTLRAIMDDRHKDFLDQCLIKGKRYDSTPANAELSREIYAAWCKVCFPDGALSEQTIDNIAMGQKLRLLRLRRGFGVDRVSEVLGITKKTLYAYEGGICQVRLEVLYKLSRLYDFSIDELFEDKSILIFRQESHYAEQ